MLTSPQINILAVMYLGGHLIYLRRREGRRGYLDSDPEDYAALLRGKSINTRTVRALCRGGCISFVKRWHVAGRFRINRRGRAALSPKEIKGKGQ